ncbi:DUF479 domain-containing protein [Gramella sp. AN32]|nr:acyl carrier protein phosphodiesterase [Gramella sp. AN32]MCM4157144.1 DUF479 domain-containing protein [Gramella sp. AN32]
MNYLAHIYLSGDNELLKIGNFMADSIKGKKYLQYAETIQNGIILHRAIDYYTDTHPVVRQSIRKLFPTYGHYSGIIIDIFYDHFLAANWKRFSTIPLKDYTEDFFKLLESNYEVLPKKVKAFMPFMIKDNWLLSYAEIEGIKRVLGGMNRRTGNKSGMDKATKELDLYYSDFEDEFFTFFEDLEDFSKKRIFELEHKKKPEM